MSKHVGNNRHCNNAQYSYKANNTCGLCAEMFNFKFEFVMRRESKSIRKKIVLAFGLLNKMALKLQKQNKKEDKKKDKSIQTDDVQKKME